MKRKMKERNGEGAKERQGEREKKREEVSGEKMGGSGLRGQKMNSTFLNSLEVLNILKL